jgi:hypothetical protein
MCYIPFSEEIIQMATVYARGYTAGSHIKYPTDEQLSLHFPMEIISEQLWNDVERNAHEVKLLRLEYKLGIGAFKR